MDYFLRKYCDLEKRKGRVLSFFKQQIYNNLVSSKFINIDLEIGCGHGHWLNAYAQQNSSRYCIGIDLNTKRIEKSNNKRDFNNLNNLSFLKADANEFLEFKPQNIIFSRIFIFFPDPWPKNRHHKRRLIQNAFLDKLLAHTTPHAEIYFRTDHVEYFNWTKSCFEISDSWDISNMPWPVEHKSYFEDLLPRYESLVIARS